MAQSARRKLDSMLLNFMGHMAILSMNFYLLYQINERMNMVVLQKTAIAFLREIIDEVRTVWEGPLFVRISAYDYTEGGMTPEAMSKWRSG